MASLGSFTLQSLGTLGLNTQDADDVQDPRYAIKADNCIISKNGLLESRKGFGKINGAAATGTPDIDVVFSYVENDGTENIISTGGNKIWVGTTSLIDETGGLTITNDNWQFQNYAGEVFGYNGVDAPIYWDGVLASFATIASKGTAAGIVSSGVQLSAYGRSWVVDTTTVSQISYSDLLIPEDFTGGSSGSIDLNTVWPYSNDTITALAAHNNNLIIFCEKSIVIYGNAHNVNNLYLIEVIRDIGCIARDSVQNIGDDIFFLAKDGVRSLARTIIQDNMPQKEISEPIRDDVIDSIANETPGLIRSTYNEKEGFYLINFPSVPVTWCCDVRMAQNGVYRWTKWNTQIYGLTTGSDNKVYAGLGSGWLSEYVNYNDTDITDGSEDQTYTMSFETGWIDPGVNTSKLSWKKARWYVSLQTTATFIFSWFFDFNEDKSSYNASAQGLTGGLYGAAVYGTAIYGGSVTRSIIKVPLSKTGSILKLGFDTVINGSRAGFNKADVFFKRGRIN